MLDVLQMVKSERLKPRVDAGTASDSPYEAAVASIGGLVAGSAGLALFFFPRNMRLIYSYPFLCIFGAGASIFGMVQSLIVRKSVDELVHLHWAAGKLKNKNKPIKYSNRPDHFQSKKVHLLRPSWTN